MSEDVVPVHGRIERRGTRYRLRIVFADGTRKLYGTYPTYDLAQQAKASVLSGKNEVPVAPHPTIAAPAVIHPSAHRETAVLHLGDLHVGKKECGYDTFQARMRRISDRLKDIRDTVLRQYDITKLKVILTGDVVDGHGVYPSQAYNQAIGDARAQANLCGDGLAELISNQRGLYGTVEVAAVPGNHGIGGNKFAADSQNWDILAYDRLAEKLAGRVPVEYNPEDPWVLKTQIADKYAAILNHGHRLGKSRKSVEDRIARWSSSDHFYPFHYVFTGHLHSLEYWHFNRVHYFRTGTMLTDDPYARQLGYESSVRAWLFGVHEKRPVTWTVQVDLT